VFSFSNGGYITRINGAFLRQLDFTEEEIVGKKKLEDLLTVGSKIFFQTHFYPLIKMQKKADEIFLSFLTKHKTEIPVLLNVALYDDGDSFEIFCGGMRISQRNRFEKELLEAKKIAEKALDDNVELIEIRNQLQATQFELEMQLRNLTGKKIDQKELSKVLSHDLQEPLRKIGLYSSRLLFHKHLDLHSESIEDLRKIAGFANKVRELLDNLEKFNSLDNKVIRYTQIDLAEVIEAAKNYSGLVSDKIEIELIDKAFGANQTKTFNSDFKLLVRLLNELIKNAIRFKNPAVGILAIKITADLITDNVFTEIKGKYKYEECLRLTFEDNGIGNNFNTGNAFELFRKSGAIADELGIGLAYCRRIVQLLSGKITVASKKNHGTIFTITLPLQQRLETVVKRPG
jgi:sigma-B regulation protein RsbU (phosphoserine phosphatase)